VTGSRHGAPGAYLKAFTGPASPRPDTSLYVKRTGGWVHWRQHACIQIQTDWQASARERCYM
jgi:hypothetical protein